MDDNIFFSSIDREKKKYTTLRLDPDAAEMIRKAAKSAGTTQSNVVRYLFKIYAKHIEEQSDERR